MGGEQSEKFYNEFLTQLKKGYASDKVQGKYTSFLSTPLYDTQSLELDNVNAIICLSNL